MSLAFLRQLGESVELSPTLPLFSERNYMEAKVYGEFLEARLSKTQIVVDVRHPQQLLDITLSRWEARELGTKLIELSGEATTELNKLSVAKCGAADVFGECVKVSPE